MLGQTFFQVMVGCTTNDDSRDSICHVCQVRNTHVASGYPIPTWGLASLGSKKSVALSLISPRLIVPSVPSVGTFYMLGSLLLANGKCSKTRHTQVMCIYIYIYCIYIYIYIRYISYIYIYIIYIIYIYNIYNTYLYIYIYHNISSLLRPVLIYSHGNILVISQCHPPIEHPQESPRIFLPIFFAPELVNSPMSLSENG